MIENRAIGIKSREVYEAPAAMTLIAAHRALEDLVLTKAELTIKRGIEVAWARTVYDGLWFTPVREALDAFVDKTQELVAGDVRVQLRAAAAVVNGRRSENALYAETLASYATGETFPHEAAEGFIRLASLEAELAAARARAVPAYDALGGTGRGPARARGVGVPPRATTPSCFPTTSRRRGSTRAGSTPPGCSRDDELAEVERGSRAIDASDDRGVRRGRPLGDRAAARAGRTEDPRGPLAQRPGRRGVPPLRRWTRATRRWRRSARRARPCSTAPRRRPTRRCPATRTSSARSRSRSATTCSRGWRCSSATATRFRFAAAQARAVAARRRRARRLDAAAPAPPSDAQLARRGRRPRLRARLPLRVRRAVRPPLADRRGAGLWATAEFGFVAPARGRPRPARR